MMMYLGIFVFSILTASALGQTEEVPVEPFSCPFCEAKTLQECDAKIQKEECTQDHPVCVLTISPEGFFRKCKSKERYDNGKRYCDAHPEVCTMSMCKVSGCKALEPFFCPTCEANSIQECDATIKRGECWEDNPVCVLYQSFKEGQSGVYRKCKDNRDYNYAKNYCDENPEVCSITMCEQSDCKAELDKTVAVEPLSCPICEGETLQECDAEITQEECSEDDPVCVLTRSRKGFFRKCKSRKSFNSGKRYCDGHPEVCSMSMCEQSGCKAELVN